MKLKFLLYSFLAITLFAQLYAQGNTNSFYTIIISSSKNKSGMEEESKATTARTNIPTFVARFNVPNKGVYYRLCAGKLATKREAEDYLSKIRKQIKTPGAWAVLFDGELVAETATGVVNNPAGTNKPVTETPKVVQKKDTERANVAEPKPVAEAEVKPITEPKPSVDTEPLPDATTEGTETMPEAESAKPEVKNESKVEPKTEIKTSPVTKPVPKINSQPRQEAVQPEQKADVTPVTSVNPFPTDITKQGLFVPLDGKKVLAYKESYALLIGVGSYTNGWPNIRNMRENLKALEEVLKNTGFTTKTILNPDAKKITDELSSFIGLFGMKPNCRLLVYFGGHGYTVKTVQGVRVGYFIPADAPLPGKNEEDFRKKTIELGSFESYAKQIKSKHVLFLFDACFSGTFLLGSSAEPEDISQKTLSPVRQFIIACGKNEKEATSDLFIKQLIKGLQGEADLNTDTFITGTELASFLQSSVETLSNHTQNIQYCKLRIPELNEGDFLLVPASSQGASPKKGPGTSDSRGGILKQEETKSKETVAEPGQENSAEVSGTPEGNSENQSGGQSIPAK